MTRDLGIADRLRAHGLPVVEVAGWQTAGSDSFNPRGAVAHHTAGPSTGVLPSLGTLVDGRSDLPGPLCNVAQSREPSGVDAAYVISSGTANHAGSGGWQGLSGNSSVYGLEVEHDGISPLPEHRQQTAARILAALIDGTADAGMVCQHHEWTTRKIDIAQGVDPHRFRDRIATCLTVTAPTPVSGGLVSVLPVLVPYAKTGQLSASGRWACYGHNDTQLLGYNSAAVEGDRAVGGTDQDSIEGRCPRAVDVPVSPGARLIGIMYGSGNGQIDPSIVIAVDSTGATFAYRAS